MSTIPIKIRACGIEDFIFKVVLILALFYIGPQWAKM